MAMRLRLLFSLLGFTLMMAGCSPSVPGDGGRDGLIPDTIRVGFSTSADMGDVPTLMALDLLRDRGYMVEPIFFAGADLSVAALAAGDVHFGNGSTRTHWAAIAKDAEIMTIMEQASNAWSIVSTPDITACANLQGRRLAITSSGSLNAALLKAYITMNCPGTEPTILLIANSENRAAALMAGEIDAAPLETSDVLRVDLLAPGRFHRLVDFAASLPGLKTTGVYTNRVFGQQYPEVVKEYLEAVLTVHRQIKDDPGSLEQAIVLHLGVDRGEAADLAKPYLEANVWSPNGGIDMESVTYSIDFFTKTGSLPSGLTAESVADLTYLDQLLEKIGRT